VIEAATVATAKDRQITAAKASAQPYRFLRHSAGDAERIPVTSTFGALPTTAYPADFTEARFLDVGAALWASAT
jgi:hypothetical protein